MASYDFNFGPASFWKALLVFALIGIATTILAFLGLVILFLSHVSFS